MKQIAAILLMSISFNSIGQEGINAIEPIEKKPKKVQIGVNISPDICYRTLKNNDGSSQTDQLIKEHNKQETYKIGYTAGLNLCYNIKKQFGIEAGIQFSNKGYQTRKLDFYSFPPDPNSPTKTKFIYNYNYLDIPVKINYTMGSKKIRFIASAGISTNILLNATETMVLVYPDKTDRNKTGAKWNYKKVNISPLISAGIDYIINSKMNLRVEPAFRYGMLKIIDTPISAFLYSGGVNISFYLGI